MSNAWAVVCGELLIYFWYDNGINSELPDAESSAMVSNSGIENAFTMFVALSVKIVDTFDARLQPCL